MEQIPRTVKNFLEELGFNNTEITVINTLLKENGLSLRQICRNAGKSSGVVSEALKKLIAKRIVLREIVNDSPTYNIENPDTIARWVGRETDKNINVLKQKRQDFEQFSKTLVANSVSPKIRFFTGMDGLKESYMNIIEYKPTEIMSYLSVTEEYQKELADVTASFVRKRVENNIVNRIIARISPMIIMLKQKGEEELRKVRLVSEKQFPAVNSEVNLYGNCMHCTSLDPQGIFAFIVEDPHMVSISKAAFELAWRESEHENVAIEKILTASSRSKHTSPQSNPAEEKKPPLA